MNKEIMTLNVRLEGLRESMSNIMMLHNEEIEHILDDKLKEVLSVEAFSQRIKMEFENAIDNAVDEFFSNTGEGYSVIKSTVHGQLIELLRKKIGGDDVR